MRGKQASKREHGANSKRDSLQSKDRSEIKLKNKEFKVHVLTDANGVHFYNHDLL